MCAMSNNSLGESGFEVLDGDEKRAHEQADHVNGHAPTKEELEAGYIPTQADFKAGYIPAYEDIIEHRFFQNCSDVGEEDQTFKSTKQNTEGHVITIVFDFDGVYVRWALDQGKEPERPAEDVGQTAQDKSSQNRVFAYISQNKIKLAALLGVGILAFVISKYLNKSEKISA